MPNPDTGDIHSRISEYVFHHAAMQPANEAMVWGDQRVSYGALADQVTELSKALLAYGIQRGDRIAMLGTPRPEFLLVLMATVDIGAIWMGMHPRYQLQEFRHVVELAAPRLVFAFNEIDDRNYSRELNILQEEFDCIEQVIVFDTATPATGILFEQFIGNISPVSDDQWDTARQSVDTDDPAVIIFTSGTTGRPKGAMNSHFGLVHCAHVELGHWPGNRIRVLQNMPINHIANIGMMTSYCMVAGGTLVFQDRFDAGELLRIIERERITFWLQSPVQFHLASAHPEFAHADLSSIQYLIWGGGPMPLHLVERLHQLGLNLATAYGMTELTAYATYSDANAPADILAGSIGRPDSSYDLRLMKANGAPATVGESGEIQAAGRWLMRGYFNQPDATAEAFTRDGWFKTGDVAELLIDGNWRLVGRTKEMYKSGGFNIYPREIEIALEQHPAVALTAVLGVADDIYHEVGYAFVQPVAGMTVDVDALARWCRDHLANYKIPKTFEIMPTLPTLPIGKIDKQALRRSLDQIVKS